MKTQRIQLISEKRDREMQASLLHSTYLKEKRARSHRNSYLRLIIILVLLHVLFVCSVFAQLMTNNNVGITISSAAQLTVKGDIQNNSGTYINNDGTIDLSGDWTHNAANNCFQTSAGTVMLNGANQTIGGTSATAFNNLTLLGSGTKTLDQDISTGGMYANPAGIIDVGTLPLNLNGHTLTVTNPSGDAVDFSSGYMISELTDNSSKVEWMIGSNIGQHIIPFGRASGVQVPLMFLQTSGNAGSITASTYSTSPTNTPYPTAPASVTNITYLGNGDYNFAVDRYWSIETLNPCTADIKFSFDPLEAPAAGSGVIYAQYYEDGSDVWLPPLPTQNNPTSTSIMLTNTSDFGTYGAARGASPLPINLLSFDAKSNKNKQVDVYWQTSSEIDNDYFTVERSRDGIHFEEVTIVNGAGNTTALHNYQIVDEKPYHGLSYYRLKQTDFDGKSSYTGSVSVLIKDDATIDFVMYPNPAANTLTIFPNIDNGTSARLLIYDSVNKLVLEQELSYFDAINQIDISNLAPGVYFCSMQVDNEKVQVKRLVVSK
jgi:hypothetical protein